RLSDPSALTMWTVPLVIAAFAVALLGLGAIMDDRRARAKRFEAVVEASLPAIPLLHSINDDRCIGCEACIDVCPTEVLDLVDHKVRVARFSDCVQCEQCATSCPTMALVMYREGTTPRMLTVPELDEHFQTGIPGQYLIGEVAGKPLVKNAANLGRAVIEHVVRELAVPGARLGGRDVLDVVIVGSGPGGLSAGLTCQKRKLSCLVLEKEHIISSTVSRYPKGKHFMAEPSTATNVSFLPVFDGSKEELVAAWQQVVEGVKLPIKLGEAVETVKKGTDGLFEVRTTVGTYRARRVVLATGLRGKPRLLVVPGANLEKVQSLLDDPGEFAGLDVLVVGGGDSAVEGAMSLADVGARVILSYRGDGFKRCKAGNQKRLAEMTAAGKLSVLLESNVAEFTADAVRIKLADGTTQTSPNQRAFVLIGADTPVAWLETNNVRFIEQPHLYTLGASDEVVRRLIPEASECPRSAAESIAMVRGHAAPPPPHRGRVRAVVGHLRDELREAVEDLSGVFKLSDLEPQRGRIRTPVGGVPAKVIPAQRLARGKTTGAARTIPNDFARHERTITSANPFAPERPVTTANPFGAEPTLTGSNPFAPERTIVGKLPLRPRSQQAAPKPAKPPPPPFKRPAMKVGFDTSDLESFGRKLPFDDDGDEHRTEVDRKIFRERGVR
ncbi:MAG TPA: NAD(P)-binding domain-containing protein, partial [Kofleriaceae bacterium]|nr:NAD(P)-binding domain-containing protein [Kofleriaceae bacterium]